MGQVKVGDLVLDEAGRPCRVTNKFSPKSDEQYRITFSDGNFIDACADHQWLTWTHAARKAFLRSPYEDTTRFPENWPQWRLRRRSLNAVEAPQPRIRTTKAILATLRHGKRGDRNHCIPCCAPLELPEARLPIMPYTLGAWLGDGASAGATITCHESDQLHTRAMIEADGFETTDRKNPQAFGVLGLHALLRVAGLLYNKHVPLGYLRASKDQRLALLRGLMDSDGNVEQGSTVAFVNTNKVIVDAVEELVHSLGMKTRIWSGVGECDGKLGKQFWRIQFTPTINPFSMPRKAARIVLGGNQSLRNYHRMIVSVEPIDPVPMSCITVDSPNSMYLAGNAMVPTHNSRCGAESVRQMVCGTSPLQGTDYGHIAIVAETARDARDVMIEGPCGLLSVHPKDFRPTYEPSKSRLTWPNGAVAGIFNAVDPEQLRGPNTSLAWCDEWCKWRYVNDAWDNLKLGLRIGSRPRAIITTTPKPIPLLRELIKDRSTFITGGSTYDNRANLAPSFFDSIITKYEGTRLGRQELMAEILDDAPGSLWSRSQIDKDRIKLADLPSLIQVAISIDPSVSSKEKSDECGLIAAGVDRNNHGYVLEDRSGVMSPTAWATTAVEMYHYHKANYIVAEVNNGGDMVIETIHGIDANIKVYAVHATRGKLVRAEPISLFYEQHRVHHVGSFPYLEDQLCSMTPDFDRSQHGSPDRMDSLVWNLTKLMVKSNNDGFLQYYKNLSEEHTRHNGKLIMGNAE